MYLICTKSRGFQRKHVQVCERCDRRGDCEAFQAHRRQHPPEPLCDAESPSAVEVPLSALIDGLADIRKWADAHDVDGGRLRRLRRQRLVAKPDLVRCIKNDLEVIRSLLS